MTPRCKHCQTPLTTVPRFLHDAPIVCRKCAGDSYYKAGIRPYTMGGEFAAPIEAEPSHDEAVPR